MTKRQTQWLLRILLGGGAGALLVLALWGPLFIGGYSIPPACQRLMDALGLPGAAGVTLALAFGFGAAVGVATLPFEDEGVRVLRRSLLHFAVTACLFSGLLVLSLGMEPRWLPLWLLLLSAVYLVIWLGRWVGWYGEVRQLRRALGLDEGPSPLHWRETLPYLPVLLLVNAGLPLLLTLLDAPDVPVLRALVLPYLVLPLGGFFPALSLGKRQGLRPLYPLVSLLVFVPVSLWVYQGQAVPLFWAVALAAPLLGNLAGWAWRRSGLAKQRRS